MLCCVHYNVGFGSKVYCLLNVQPPGVSGYCSVWLLTLLGVVVTDLSTSIYNSPSVKYAAMAMPFYGTYVVTLVIEIMFMDTVYVIHTGFRAINRNLETTSAYQLYPGMHSTIIYVLCTCVRGILNVGVEKDII